MRLEATQFIVRALEAALHLPSSLASGLTPMAAAEVLCSSFSHGLPIFFRAQRKYNCEFAGGACTTAICRTFCVALDTVRKGACM